MALDRTWYAVHHNIFLQYNYLQFAIKPHFFSDGNLESDFMKEVMVAELNNRLILIFDLIIQQVLVLSLIYYI